MRYKYLVIFWALGFCNSLSAQNQLVSWFKTNGFSIRQTFDGSKYENNPASLKFTENHRSNNDFFNVDLALKIAEIGLVKGTDYINFYPKVEYHKSTDSIEEKDKLSGGINFEFFPFELKLANPPKGKPNDGCKLAPWFLATSSFKRNFLDNVNETKLSFQMSFASKCDYLPGAELRGKDNSVIMRYYPYVGWEYNHIPDLVQEGEIEEFNTYFLRLFAEIWLVPQTIQTNTSIIYRRNLRSSSMLRQDLPLFTFQLNFYPGKQDAFSIGYEYKNGYEPDSKFNLAKTSSIKLNLKV